MQPQVTNPPRNLSCARCGTSFECGNGGDLAGNCWCAAEPYKMPLTAAGASEDCLCPACLRKAAPATQSA